MITDDLLQWSQRLQSVSDDDLRSELIALNYNIENTKFQVALSCYLATAVVQSLPLDIWRKHAGFPAEAPEAVTLRSQMQAATVLRAYICFVYMWADDLEHKLDGVSEQSPIQPFVKFFRKGSLRQGNDSVAQHIRNSLAHGSFDFILDEFSLIFKDDKADWVAKVDVNVFHADLCPQIKRFYLCAFEAKHSISGLTTAAADSGFAA